MKTAKYYLNNYKYGKREDGTFVHDDLQKEAKNCKQNNYSENISIINKIVLWKINRMVDVNNNIVKVLNDSKNIKSVEELINKPKFLFDYLPILHSKGIKLPMASTLLHFYNPKVFPIIDQRAVRALKQEKITRKETPSSIPVELWADKYFEYINKCYKKWKLEGEGIDFSDVDKWLYQMDKENKNKNI